LTPHKNKFRSEFGILLEYAQQSRDALSDPSISSGGSVLLEHRKRLTHYEVRDLNDARTLAVEKVYRNNAPPYAVCQAHKCPTTRGPIVTVIEWKPEAD
jgi:hypothetical protein